MFRKYSARAAVRAIRLNQIGRSVLTSKMEKIIGKNLEFASKSVFSGENSELCENYSAISAGKK